MTSFGKLVSRVWVLQAGAVLFGTPWSAIAGGAVAGALEGAWVGGAAALPAVPEFSCGRRSGW